MSLEKSIEELNGSIKALIEALASAGASTAGTGDDDAKAEKPKRTRKSKKPDEDATEKPSSKKSKKSDDVPSVDDIRKVFGDFMRVDDEEDREKRKTYVKNVLKEYGVKRATDLAEEDRADAIKVIEDEAKRLADAEDDGDLV